MPVSANPYVSDLDCYLFDLNGFLVLKQALSRQEVSGLNTVLDAIPFLEPGQWHGNVQAHQYGGSDGLNLQQVYEAGEPFEQLIDHPAWFERVKHFVGGEGTFDCHHGPLFIDENFANFREPGGGIGLHSGGDTGIKRNQFRYHNGRFQCGQINILMALTDIGPGDGATMVVPCSHKASFPHPHAGQAREAVDGVEGAIEVFLEKGDALLFTDTLSHGSARRVNPGVRRIVVYRYGPSWGNFRHGYQPSAELLARLAPVRRQIVQPLQLIPRPQGKQGV